MQPSPLYTIRPVLVDKKNKRGMCVVKILVSYKGQRTLFTVGLRVKKSEWKNESVIDSHPSSNNYNKQIRNKLTEIDNLIVDQLDKLGTINLSLLKKNKEYNIVKYMDLFVSESQAKYAFNTLKRYTIEAERLKKYDAKITFNAIDTGFLRRYEAHLRKTMNTNSVHGTFKILKAIYKRAIKEGITKHFPFKDYDNPKYKQTDRTYLTKTEVDKFEKALNKPYDKGVYESGMYFLLGCYTGLRVSDLLRFNKDFIQGDRIILRTVKTGGLVSMKMNKKLKQIVKVVLKLKKPVNEDYINRDIKTVAIAAGIEKNIYCHVARHSFAVRCLDSGMTSDTVATLMGITLNVFESSYKKLSNKKIDKEFEMWQ